VHALSSTCHTSLVTANAHRVNYTFREYLAHEAVSNVKHEFLDGQIYAMAGGTPSHAALASAVTGQLYPQLRGGPCRSFSSDLRIRVLATGLTTYPDVTIVCGAPELDPDDENTVTNPTLIVEVLSPSTEEYDRGEKLEHYQRIPSLRQVVLVAQDARRLDVWTRGDGDAWTVADVRDGVANLGSIGARLDVSELYEASR
jgi:Uma2 family endonuclease